jgi:hypothetical protein
MSFRGEALFMPTPIYSNTETEIESILPFLFDFSVKIPSVTQDNGTSSRSTFFSGENLKIHVIITPNFTNVEALKKFGTIFDCHDDHSRVWKSLFATLQISTNFTTSLPSATENEMKINRDGEIITSYVFKSKTRSKKSLDSSSVNQTRKGVETETGLFFEMDLHVPKKMTGTHSLLVEFHLCSQQYEQFTLKSFQDVFPQRSKMEKSLFPFASSFYIDGFLFLGSMAIPVKISNPLLITSSSRLLNMKGMIQCTFENTSESKMELKNFSVHVLATKVQPIVDVDRYRDLITSTSRDIKLDPLKSPFNFVYTHELPVVLKPSEKYSMFLQVFPNHVENNEAIYSSKSPFIEYSSLITMDYQLSDLLFSSEHFIRWNFIQDRGLIVSIEAPQIVKANSSFNVVYVIKNFLPRKCEFTVTIQGTEVSPLYCVENILNIGSMDQHQVKKLSLTYHSKRGGTFDLFELLLYDKLNKETYRSLCKRKVFVDEKEDESIFEKIENVSDEKEDVVFESQDFGVLANENAVYEKVTEKIEPITPLERKPLPMPLKRAPHLRSRSNEIGSDQKSDETKGILTPDIESMRARRISNATFVVTSFKDDKERQRRRSSEGTGDGEEIALDSPTFVDDGEEEDAPVE